MDEDLELDKFEAELLNIFEKRKFLLTKYTEEGFGIQGEGLAEIKVKATDFFKLYKEGKTAEEIADMILSGNQRRQAEKPHIDNIYPLIKDKYFAVGYQNALKQAAEKAKVPWDPGYLPVMFKNWPEHDIYIFAGVPVEQGYRFVSNVDFERIGVDDKQFFAAIMENLQRRVEGFLKEGKVKITKKEEGIFVLNMEADLAASFPLIAYKYFEFLKTNLGSPQAEFFYAITITTEEIILCDPKISRDVLEGIVVKSRERQKEFVNSIHHPMTMDVMVITKAGIGFLPKN